MNISIFTTTYNEQKYLREAIDSVLAQTQTQTLPPAQLIVVDASFGDGSPDIIADYTCRYPELFTPIYHAQNTGISQVCTDVLNTVRGGGT